MGTHGEITAFELRPFSGALALRIGAESALASLVVARPPEAVALRVAAPGLARKEEPWRKGGRGPLAEQRRTVIETD